MSVLRCNLDSHQRDDCRLRESFCKFCRVTGTHEFITTDHYRACTDYPIECPNGCGETVCQRNIEDHLASCPMQEVKCKYSVFGCTTMPKRSEADQHEAQKKDYHLGLSLDKMPLLIQTVADMYSVTQSLSQRLTSMEGQSRQVAPYYANQGGWYGTKAPTNPEPVLLPPNPLAVFTSRPWLENKTLFPSSPWIFRLDQFEKCNKENTSFYSHVFSHPTGYKFAIRVDARGVCDEDRDYVSAYCYIEGSDNDARLKWPFSGQVVVTLLNQTEDKDHVTHTIVLRNQTEDVVCKPWRKSTRNEGRGEQCFIAHRNLTKPPDVHCQYLKDDCLYFRIEITVD